MARIVPSPCRWSTRRYIIAVFLGTIATAAAITAISVVLHPAHIYFSITQASVSNRTANHLGIVNLTLAAKNPSRRAGVLYRKIVVCLYFLSAERRSAICTKSTNSTALFQAPRSTITIPKIVPDYDASTLNNASTGVQVEAKVQFKVGLAYSRPYGMIVVCKHVNFTHFNTDVPITCSG